MLLKAFVVVLLFVAGVLLYAGTRPGNFQIARTCWIDASPQSVFPLVNDLHNWNDWSPYTKLDPAMKITLSGAPKGQGAVYEWSGNMQAGAGRMEITNSVPSSDIAIDLAMSKPMKGRNDVEFRFTPSKGGTEVTWAMRGNYAYPVKVMSIFMNMDNMLGSQFDEGLHNLKRVAEAFKDERPASRKI